MPQVLLSWIKVCRALEKTTIISPRYQTATQMITNKVKRIFWMKLWARQGNLESRNKPVYVAELSSLKMKLFLNLNLWYMSLNVIPSLSLKQRMIC